MTHVTEKVEPEALSAPSPQEMALYSIAISLKRIADALGGPINNYGETFGEAIQGQIARGLRGIDG